MIFVIVLSVLSVLILYMTRKKIEYSLPATIVVYLVSVYFYLKGNINTDVMLDDHKFFD